MFEDGVIKLRVADLMAAINQPYPKTPNHLFEWLGEDLADRVQLDYVYSFSLSPTEEGTRAAIFQFDINGIPMMPDSRIQIGRRARVDARGRERVEWFLRDVDGKATSSGLDERQSGVETLSRRYRVAGRDLRARTIRAFTARTGFRTFARDLEGVSFENNDASQLRISGERKVPNTVA